MTPEEAVQADIFHRGTCLKIIGPRGGVRWRASIYRRSGKTQLAKGRPGTFRIPIKSGLNINAHVTEWNCFEFHADNQCSEENRTIKVENHMPLHVEPPAQPGIIGYKFIMADHTSYSGNSGKWHLGRIKGVNGELKLCVWGFHQSPTIEAADMYKFDTLLCITEGSPECKTWNDKSVHRWMRILWWGHLKDGLILKLPDIPTLLRKYYPQYVPPASRHRA